MPTTDLSISRPTASLEAITIRHDSLFSNSLHRAVQVTFLLPTSPLPAGKRVPVLYLNDGQDIERLNLVGVLNDLYKTNSIPPIIVVGVHANQDRLQEYGTASQPDYKGRGAKAGLYSQFLLQELMPYVERTLPIQTGPTHTVIAGFSLGGLSALDLAWAHPEKFGKVGVFSGSLWWRKKAYEDEYDDHNDRIMHTLVRNSLKKPPLKFWFEVGTNDETSDRNGNGIIDAIDDTLDLMGELQTKGYHRETDIRYVEMPGGRHDQETWSKAMPDFLTWAFVQ